LPGKIALSAIGKFQINEAANHEANDDAGFPGQV
jgi:hypothetical protein